MPGEPRREGRRRPLEERYGDVEPSAFHSPAAAARGAEDALVCEVGRLEAAVDVERETLADDVLFADEPTPRSSTGTAAG